MSELLRATNLSFAYGSRMALSDVSLTLSSGQVITVIGPNGSGKSTLIRVLLGQHRLSSGGIAWEGRLLHHWKHRDLARRIAYLPQTPSADPEQTVREVLRIGRAPYWRAFGVETVHDEEAVARTSEQLDLNDLLERRLGELSGGQRQRVFIGRCLVQEPVAMLLDEPNTYLDLRHQIALGQLVRNLARQNGIGVIMASHDLNLAAIFADRMLLLEDGVVGAIGTPDEVLRADVLGRAFGVEMETITRAGSSPIVVPRIADDASIPG